MTEVVTAARMRAVERAAIDAGTVTGLALMERAGRGAVDAILAEWPALAAGPRRAVVLCGPGNNGGDGFVVARLLRDRGWEVLALGLGDPARLPPDAAANRARWGGPVAALTGEAVAARAVPGRCDLLVDALFGIGLSRPVDLPLAALGATRADRRTVALDVPSGLSSETGRAVGREAVTADLTVAFHAPKPGHFLADGPALCGKLEVADIGLAPDAPEDGAALHLVGAPRGTAKRGGHKFDHGHALVLSGGVGRGGAARMAARGALRVGAGLVTLGCPPAALIENAARLDAIMLRPVRDADALAGMLDDPRLNALCLGPGLGTGPREAALLAAALRSDSRAVVLDGDALTLLGRDPDLLAALHPRCVLTPHMGEFARVFPDLAERLDAPAADAPAFSKVDAARAAAARAGCTVLLKGPDTAVAAPGGRAAIASAAYDRAAPWLATAGAGDVLAGLIAGLCARGRAPFDAACAAAWLHVECARAVGPGLIAEDLPEALPGVLARLEGWTPPG